MAIHITVPPYCAVTTGPKSHSPPPIFAPTITRPGQFVEPVQLQVVCYQLWENLKNWHTGAITRQDLEQSGDVDTALASFYEEAIASVLHDRRVGGASEIAVRNWFDQQLMTEAGTRGMVYRGETHTAGLPNGIVKLLEDRYLLRYETRRWSSPQASISVWARRLSSGLGGSTLRLI